MGPSISGRSLRAPGSLDPQAPSPNLERIGSAGGEFKGAGEGIALIPNFAEVIGGDAKGRAVPILERKLGDGRAAQKLGGDELASLFRSPGRVERDLDAPEKSRCTWMSWIVLPVTVLKAQPRLPTTPVCSQCEMSLWRTR